MLFNYLAILSIILSNFLYLGHSIIPHSHPVIQGVHHHDSNSHKHHKTHYPSNKKDKHKKEQDNSNVFSFFTHNSDIIELSKNTLEIKKPTINKLFFNNLIGLIEKKTLFISEKRKKQKIPEKINYISPHCCRFGLRAPPYA